MNHTAPTPVGHYTLYWVDSAGLWTPLFRRKNQIQYDWARIACQCIGKGKANYKVNAIYVEFENVASPGDPVSIPDFDRTEKISYYSSLSGTRDYLRLPLISEPALAVASEFTDIFTGDGDDVNEMTFFAQTVGVTGVNGLDFSSAANSVAFGIALVATPVWADRTQDLVFGRSYFDLSEQVAKTASHQIGVSWSQMFG